MYLNLGADVKSNSYAIFEVPERKQTVDQYVTKLLIQLGLKVSYRGFNYLKDAIVYCIENPCEGLITKIVYPHIAEKYNTTYGAVERGIRVALESMPNTTFRTAIFEGNNTHFTNKEFILHIARYVYCNR